MVLVQGGSERSATSSTRARCLLTRASTDRGAAHEIGSFVGIAAVLLGAEPPEDQSNDAERDGTTNTNDNTNDNFLVRFRET